jgi:hypothetical protein
LAGENPQPFVPVLASDTVKGVMQLLAGTDLQTIPGETSMEGMLEAIHDGTDLLVGGLRMTARASQTQAA